MAEVLVIYTIVFIIQIHGICGKGEVQAKRNIV